MRGSLSAQVLGRGSAWYRTVGIVRSAPREMDQTLLGWRREATPTPPAEDQLRWADEA